MNPSADFEEYDPSKHWIAPARNFRSSARLHLQHFLAQNTLGYLLDPIVEQAVANNSQSLRVADLACGNGIWLSELHSHLASKNIPAQLDGFDINPINFPHPAYLPPTVTLSQLDILAKPLPAHLLGKYDVVHIRSFVSVIADADLTPVLSIAWELLKPGGYLQWEENRGDKFYVESPSPQISKAACDTIVQALTANLQARGIVNDWVDVLDTYLEEFGFEDVRLRVQDKRRQDFKGWTEDYLMVWEELATYFPPKATDPNARLSREAWTELFARAVKETEQGVVVHQRRFISAIGMKPL
ncbi:S-adenosyl-L-methionine-dependent methyltransferase [Nemania sp. FL0916]|nr:S-adenosyl-L-methionine-dependent methyltransferase [Nemania sp. FL0916]